MPGALGGSWGSSRIVRGPPALPWWLRGCVDDLLAVQYAVATGRLDPERMPPGVQRVVLEASPAVRQRAAEILIGIVTDRRHAWLAPPEHAAQLEPGSPEEEQARLEGILSQLAASGDLDAIQARLAALDPKRYGKRGDSQTIDATDCDTVDFIPLVEDD